MHPGGIIQAIFWQWRAARAERKACVTNLASYKDGVGYGEWMHIDAWSESIVEYVRVLAQTGHGEPGN